MENLVAPIALYEPHYSLSLDIKQNNNNDFKKEMTNKHVSWI